MKKLNFGCGKVIKKNYINVDITAIDGVDKVFDFNNIPYPFDTNYFDEIYCDNVLEHLDNIPKVMKELHRICKNNALIKIIVPYYNCYGAYNDITHKHYFSHLSFEPFYKSDSRGNYFIDEKFALKKIEFVPTRLGKIVPSIVRLPLSNIFGQIIQTINVELIVCK